MDAVPWFDEAGGVDVAELWSRGLTTLRVSEAVGSVMVAVCDAELLPALANCGG